MDLDIEERLLAYFQMDKDELIIEMAAIMKVILSMENHKVKANCN